MKIKCIIIILLFFISFENGFAQYFFDAGENPAESNFPGGYVSLAVQIGKNSNGNSLWSFWSYQISAGIALPPADASTVSLFAGICIGHRKFKNDDSYNYYDLQLSVSPFAGIGIGKAKVGGELRNRRKAWIGLGPIIYSRDWLNLQKGEIANGGLMFSLPVLVSYGNQFYP